jgi:hypothetical protein
MGTTSTKLAAEWNEAEVSTAVASIGAAFEQYCDLAMENGLDGKTMLTLEAGDLEELIPTKLHRKRLLAELAKIKAFGVAPDGHAHGGQPAELRNKEAPTREAKVAAGGVGTATGKAPEPPIVLDDAGGLDNARVLKIVNDILPAIMRIVFKIQWKAKWGVNWEGNGREGLLFLNGGTLPPCNQPLSGGAEVKPGGRKLCLSEVLPGSLDIRPGDSIRIEPITGIGGVTTLVDKICGPGMHGVTKEIMSAGSIGIKDVMAGTCTETGTMCQTRVFCSLNRVPKAERKDLKSIDQFVKRKIETGILDTMDVTALNFMLMGEKNHQLLPKPSRQNEKDLLQGMQDRDLSTSEWIVVMANLRNSTCHPPCPSFRVVHDSVSLFFAHQRKQVGWHQWSAQFTELHRRLDMVEEQMTHSSNAFPGMLSEFKMQQKQAVESPADYLQEVREPQNHSIIAKPTIIAELTLLSLRPSKTNARLHAFVSISAHRRKGIMITSGKLSLMKICIRVTETASVHC